MSAEIPRLPQRLIDSLNISNPGRPDVVEQVIELAELSRPEYALGMYGVKAEQGRITMMVGTMPNQELNDEYQEMLRSIVKDGIPVEFMDPGEPALSGKEDSGPRLQRARYRLAGPDTPKRLRWPSNSKPIKLQPRRYNRGSEIDLYSRS